MKQEKKDKILSLIFDEINKNQLTLDEIKELVESFLYSLGASIENKNYDKAEDVFIDYMANPTFGKALMSQALIFKDKWINEKDDQTER